MSSKTTCTSAIGLSLLAIVFGCSRTDKDVSGVKQPSPRSAESNETRDAASNSVVTKPGEQSATTNNDPSQPEKSAALNDAEILDTDEPGNDRRDALTKLAQERPNVIENRNEDQDDPSVEPAERLEVKQAASDPPLDNGRADGDAPNPQLASNAVDVAATTQAVEDGRGEADAAASEKREDIAKFPGGKQTLPENLQALDKNKDGQIALAEWPRDTLAEFNKLDKNKNGFLTSQEWLAGLAKADQDEAGKRAADAPAVSEDQAVEVQPASQDPIDDFDADK